VIVKLLGYAPDASPDILGVITQCANVVPTTRGMKAAPSPADAGMATLAATCMGSAVLIKTDGTTRFFAGTHTKIYEAGASTWSDVSRAASYTAGTTARWRFAQQELVSFAANGTDTVQASVSTGAFSCISGAPVAAIVETVGKFVFALNISNETNGVQWCALGDYTDWVESIATQAGADTLTESPGPITAGRKFGNALIVYKKNSMYTGVNVGPPNVWQFDLIPGDVGALSQEVVVNIGTPENPKQIFMGEDNFYLYDGSRPIPIGTGSVKETVFGHLLGSRYYAATALHDRKNNLIYFYYPVADSALPDKCVVYNYRVDRWGVDDRQIEAATDFVAPAITYGGLGALYATYGDFPNLSYGTAFLGSSQIQSAIFNTSHQLMKLTAPSTTSSFTTGDMGDDAQFTMATRVWPRFITAPTSATLTNHYKNTSGDSLTADQTVTFGSGRFDFLREARWHRLQFNFSGDWEMTGFKPEWEVTGSE
jgi:hypothetical protein